MNGCALGELAKGAKGTAESSKSPKRVITMNDLRSRCGLDQAASRGHSLPMPESPGQPEFDFLALETRPGGEAGYLRWREEMREQDEAEARRLGVPVRKRVEALLDCGVVLEGRLEFAEPELLRLERRTAKLALKIGSSVFDHSQITRCVVLDDS